MTAERNQALFADVELIEKPEVPLIDDLVAYWNRKRSGRIGPRRTEIDPTEMVAHLPHIFMLDVIDGGKDFRFRLIGTRIVEGLGRDNTGRRVSEAYRDRPEAQAQLMAVFRLPVDRKARSVRAAASFGCPRLSIAASPGLRCPSLTTEPT